LGPGGLESEPVPVLSGIMNHRYDLAWTGSEIGVVIELDPPDEGPSDFFLQRFIP